MSITTLTDDEFVTQCKSVLPDAKRDVLNIPDARHALAGQLTIFQILLREADRRLTESRLSK